MKNNISESVRKVVEDKIKYLQGVGTDYALRYANTDSQEDKAAYLMYKFAAEQFESIRTPVSIALSNLDKLIEE